jgi:hypothetical protein
MKRKNTSFRTCLVFGLGIVLGILIAKNAYRLEPVFFAPVSASEGEGEGETTFDSLTVTGNTNLEGDVAIGKPETGEPVDSVQIFGQSIETQVSGTAFSIYEEGFMNVYGDPVNNCSVLGAYPAISSTDITNYYLGFISTGFVNVQGGSGGIAVGDYASAGQGEGEELGATPDNYTGTYLAGTGTDGAFRAVAHLKTTDENGSVYIGAMQSDGAKSAIEVDASGITITLGDNSTQGGGNTNTMTSTPAAMSRFAPENASAATAATAPTRDAHQLGSTFPVPDIDYLLQRASQPNQPVQ